MNRRLTVGLALKAIPVPGMLHFYAGDSKTGKRLLTTSLLGVASIMAGAILVGEGDFPSTDFEVMVLNAGDKDEERRYEKIPVRLEGEATHYRLRELERDGIVEGRGRRGTFVVDEPPHSEPLRERRERIAAAANRFVFEVRQLGADLDAAQAAVTTAFGTDDER